MRVVTLASVVTVLVLVTIFAVSLAADAVVSFLAHAPGLGFLDGVSRWVWPGLLIFAWARGWLVINRPYNCHGSIEIDASIDDIWDHIRPQARLGTFHTGFERIVGLPGEPDRFDFILDARLRDDGANKTDRLQARISGEDAPRYLKLTYLNAADFPLFARDTVSSEYFLHQVEGGVEVSIVERLARITPAMVLAFLYLNPARDGLKRLKAAVEGQSNPSHLGAWLDDIEPESIDPRGSADT